MRYSRSKLRITFRHEPNGDPLIELIRVRLRTATQDQSCREIARRTDTHPETVRRYLSSGHPSVEFLSAVAREYDISSDWLLTGVGPVKTRDAADYVIRAAPLSRLLRAVAEKLAASEDRIGSSLKDPRVNPQRPDPMVRDISRRLYIASGVQTNSTST